MEKLLLTGNGLFLPTRLLGSLLLFIFLGLGVKATTIDYDVVRSTGISFTSISSTGSTVALWKNGNNTDDNLSTAIPIGFNFDYAGSTYTSLLVSTNGFITFNTATSALGSSSSPYGYNDDVLSLYFASPSTLTLAPFYYDLVCQGNSNLPSGLAQSIHYSVSGVAGSRVFTVEWTGMELYVTSGPDINFQVKLYETSNNIDFVYGKMEGFNGTVNVGYSYSVGLNGSTISDPPLAGEVFNQMTSNTRNFGLTPYNNQNAMPECNSKLSFTPGVYTPYVAASLIPSNDNVVNAIVLPVNASPCFNQCGTLYSSAYATNSGITGCPGTNADDDVWFKFTASGVSSTTIKLISAGNYDGTLQLFDNSMVSLECATLTGAGLIETIVSNLTAGQQYFLRVYHRFSGWGGTVSSGQFSICISVTPPPPVNDECINKINLPVTASPSYYSGTSTYSATASPSVPACSVAGTNPDDDVWYSFTALNIQETITVIGGTGFDAVVQLLSGTCGALTPVACVDLLHNGQTETLIANNLTVNQQYFIRVYHGGVGGGSGLYSIAVTAPPIGCVLGMAPYNGDIGIPSTGTELYWSLVAGADKYRIMLDSVNPPVHILGITNDTTFSIFSGALVGGKTYYWRVQTHDTLGYNTGCQINHFSTELTPIGITIRLFLEGLYSGNQTMIRLINPLDTLTDTVTISLADSTQEIMFSQNAYLSEHGYATAHFPLDLYEEFWYLIIDQRNSLQLWSNGTVEIASYDNVYDFTTSAAQAYGSNQVEMDSGVWAMHIGDLNQDGLINAFDMDEFQLQNQSFVYGNQLSDLNGDGFAESIDCSILGNKIPLQLAVQIPPLF